MRKWLKIRLSENTATSEVGIYNSCDVIGDITIVKMTDFSEVQAKAAAETILDYNKA